MNILGLTGRAQIKIGTDSALESVASDGTGVTAIAGHIVVHILALRNADLDQRVMSRMDTLLFASSAKIKVVTHSTLEAGALDGILLTNIAVDTLMGGSIGSSIGSSRRRWGGSSA